MASPVSLSETNQLQIADEAFWSNHLLHTSGALMSGAERLHAQFPLPKPSIMASICASASASPTTRLPGRYVLLVTAMNSLAQRIYTYLRDKGVEDLDLTVMVYAPGKNASRDRVEELLLDMDRFRPDFVLCPYMISKVPACIYNKVSRLYPAKHVLTMAVPHSCLSPWSARRRRAVLTRLARHRRQRCRA